MEKEITKESDYWAYIALSITDELAIVDTKEESRALHILLENVVNIMRGGDINILLTQLIIGFPGPDLYVYNRLTKYHREYKILQILNDE